MAKTVVLTRPKGPYAGDEGLSHRLQAEGFSVIHLTALSVEAREIRSEDQEALRSSIRSDECWLAFLSPTAVRVFRDQCAALHVDVLGSQARLAAQGPGTSEAVREVFHREVDLESPIALAEVFAEQFIHRLGGRGRVLVPQSADGRDVFAPIVRRSGIEVVTISTYGLVTAPPGEDAIAAVRALTPDQSFLVFMSPSAVRAIVETFPHPEDLKCLRVVSILSLIHI